MKTVEISLSNKVDVLKEIWVNKRTKALHLIQEMSEKHQDDLSQVACGYLIDLIILDGENEYTLNQERKEYEND